MKKILLITFFALIANTAIYAQCVRPVINSFSPVTGFIGSKVTITGANFDANTPSNNVVYFGATKATVTAATFGTLEVIVPVGASTAPISVTTCKLTAYSAVAFNGIFCPTPVSSTTYQNVAFDLTGVYGAYNMMSVDLDLDGKPEVVSGGSNGLSIAKNNSTSGSLSFSALNFNFGYCGNVYAADFDGDGKKDITNNTHIFGNTSTGPGNVGLSNAFYHNVAGYQVAAGDFNNDGKIDLVGNHGETIYIRLNTSTGIGNFSFGPHQIAGQVGVNCTGIQVADVDGDGKTDILATQGNANRAVSIRNVTTNGSGTIAMEAPEYWNSGGTYPYRCQVADFDKDGKIDLTSCNYTGATNTAIWRNTSTVGDISFATTVNLVAPTANYRIQVGDVDGDGYPDIVTKSLGVNVFSVYKNTSTGGGDISFATRIDYTSSHQAEVSGIVIGDLDGDYVPDIATSGINSNRIYFHRNTSAQNDVTAPTASCKNIILALKPDGTASITANDIDNGSSDACGIGSLSASKTTFSCSDIGDNYVVLTVTDKANNTATCTATVTVAPAAVIVTGQTTVCAGQTVNMSANQGDSYQWKMDGVDIPGATSQNYTASQTGKYSVEVTNSGGCSGTSSEIKITVNANPTVSVSPSPKAYLCPSAVTLTASTSATYQWMKNGVDINGANVQSYIATTTGTYSVKVIDLFGCSATSNNVDVSNSAHDISVVGNGSYGSVYPNVNNSQNFVISNSGSGDLTVSSIDFSGTNASNWSVPGTSFPLVIAGNSSATVSVVFNGPSVGDYTALMSINNDDCDESVVNINLDAKITCVAAGFSSAPSNMNVSASSTSCDAVVTFNAVASGTPSPSVSYSFSGATSGIGSGTGSGSTFNIGITTVELTSTNACGTNTITFDIEVMDNTAPTVATQDITVYLDATGNASISASEINNGSTDNCTIASYTLDETDFDCSEVGSNTVTLTVKDVNGNSSSATATVTVIDNTAPLAATQNISVTLDVNGSATITPAMINNGSNDNCSVAGLSLDKTSFNCSDIGVNTVTLTVTDPSNNATTATATVTVNHTLVANAGADKLVYYGYTPQATATLNGSATGGGGTYSYSWSTSGTTSSISVSPSTTTTYTLTVTDQNGCTATDQVVVEVNDVRCGNKMDKVTMCHNGHNICISANAVASHLNHNDCYLGGCKTNGKKEDVQGKDIEIDAHADIALNTFTAFPNPFAGTTTLQFSVPTEQMVTLSIYDIKGSLVKTLYSGYVKAGVLNNVSLDANNLSSNMYFARLISAQGVQNIKIVQTK